MRTNVDKALRGIDDVQRRALRGAERGLAPEAGGVVSELRASGAYNDQSGATRAGSAAGVQGPTLDTLTPAVAQSKATVESFNPGHGHIEDIGNAGASVVLIATVASDYQQYLSGNAGGAHDALGPTMLLKAGALAAAAARGIAEELR
jgi:hypothetical protein